MKAVKLAIRTVLALARDQEMALEAVTEMKRDLETDQEVGTEEMKRIHACTQRGMSGHHAVRAASPADLELFL